MIDGSVDVVLASSSRYRAELLRRIVPDFRQLAPSVDESVRSDETAAALAGRLASAKAHALAPTRRGALIIGSDQVAECGDLIVGKPASAAAARAQLAAASGKLVTFHTALCVLDTRGDAAREYAAHDVTRVYFRSLDADTVARYIERERPLDCAGSFKAEALGIALFERIESHDPTALIGLPLIALCGLLRAAEIEVI